MPPYYIQLTTQSHVLELAGCGSEVTWAHPGWVYPAGNEELPVWGQLQPVAGFWEVQVLYKLDAAAVGLVLPEAAAFLV